MLAVHVYMYDFWQIATIFIQSTYGQIYKNQTCISLFHTLNSCKTFVYVIYTE